MAARGVHLAVYRRITALYPSSFRKEYGADLLVLFAQQIADEHPGRVWARTVRDLAVSVPNQQLEAHMRHPPTHLITGVSGVVATTAAMLALVVGTGPAMPILLIVALLAGATAVWSWQAGQPVRSDAAVGKSWWKVMLAGPVLAGLTFGAMAVPWPAAVDLGDGAYWLIVIALMTSIVLAATGVLLGIVAGIERRRTRPTRPAPA